MLSKRNPYRNKKIRQSAKGEECTMNSPVCNFNPETTVFCHLNESFAGKGIGQKADDCAGFYGCSDCHAAYDQNRLPPESGYFYLLRAYTRTIRRLIDKGVLGG